MPSMDNIKEVIAGHQEIIKSQGLSRDKAKDYIATIELDEASKLELRDWVDHN